jgi:ATPase, YjeE family
MTDQLYQNLEKIDSSRKNIMDIVFDKNIKEYETESREDTFLLAKQMAECSVPGQVICLNGDLGVGKTVFAQGFGAGLGITEPMASPTFTILREYHEGRLPLYHFDVYRVSDIDEMEETGFFDFINGDGVTLIEWAELIEDVIPRDAVQIRIEKDTEKGFDYRRITVG